MLRIIIFAIAVTTSSVASAQPVEGQIEMYGDPQGSEAYRTTQDPGWWQRTFVGWDQNADGMYTGGERGVLLMAWDGFMGLIWGLAKPLLNRLLNLIPETRFAAISGYFAGVAYYFKIANAWLPLDYASTLLLAYYTFVGGYFVVRMTLKLVRGA